MSGLVLVTGLINGFLRTGKQERLRILVSHLNRRTCANISVLPIDKSPLYSNGWLAGFIDADGSFQANISIYVTGFVRLTTIFELYQAQHTHHGVSNQFIMNSIACFLKVKLGKLTIRNQYRVQGSSESSLLILNNYLSVHQLMSSKRLDYNDWGQIQAALTNNTARSRLDEIKALKAGMNKSRSAFDWSHLSNDFSR